MNFRLNSRVTLSLAKDTKGVPQLSTVKIPA